MKTNLNSGQNKFAKISHGQMIKAMAKIAGKDIFPEVKLSKPKRAYKPRPNARKSHQQPELILQKGIIKYLRIHGCDCGTVRVEARIWQGIHIKSPDLLLGVPDILCFHPHNGMYWIECKWGTNVLREEQKLFRELCIKHGINHIVARDLNDVEVILR